MFKTLSTADIFQSSGAVFDDFAIEAPWHNLLANAILRQPFHESSQ